MPRVHALKARKAYKAEGIKKGETYYKWKRRHGPVQRSATYPRPSQLSSAKYAVVEDAQLDAESAICAASEPDEIKSALEDLASCAREVAGEYTESADNMEQAFTGGSPTIDDCREKADALESFADSLEGWDADTTELDNAQGALDEGKAKDSIEASELQKLTEAVDDALEEIRDDARQVAQEWSP